MNGHCGACGGRGEVNGWCLWGSMNTIKMGLQGMGGGGVNRFFYFRAGTCGELL